MFGSNEDGTVVLQDPSEADFGIHLSAEKDGVLEYESKYIFSDTYSGFNVVEPIEEDAAVIRSGDLYAALSSKADARSLSNYLPLSGGTLQGSIEIPAQYGLSVGQYQLQDKDFNGFQIGDGWDSWKFGGSSEQPNDVIRRTDISAFPTTDEISATRVETMTTIHESDWAEISASASSSTLYIVIPD